MAQATDNNTLNVSAKSVAKYALLPGILPRLQRLTQHFSQFLFIFTQIFGSVGLIDKDHPCLKPENMGRYRFVDIIGLAANNVVFDRKHIPQIVMFFMVVLSIALTTAIILGLIASTIFSVHSAQAQLFGTPEGFNLNSPDLPKGVTYAGQGSDWALNFLFRIFGDTGFFPHPADGNVGNPWYTSILVGMLKYYSLAMLVVAAFMILYILIITLTEAARSGQPFGSRFDSIWAPIRLALAIGLLMPISHGGYNGAQMLAFQSAVWGSNLATNVWYGGLAQMGKNSKSFFSSMMGDAGYRFVRDMFIVNSCVAGLHKIQPNPHVSKNIQYTSIRDITGGKVTFTFGTDDAPDFCGQVEIQAVPSKPTPAGLKNASWPDKVTVGYGNIAKKFLPLPSPNYYDMAISNSGKTTETGNAIVDNTIMGKTVNYAADQFITTSGKNTNKDKGFMDVMPTAGYNALTIQSWMQVYWHEMGVMYNCDSDGEPYTVSDSTKCSGTAYRSLFFESPGKNPDGTPRNNSEGLPDYQASITAYNNWMIQRMVSDAQYGWTTAGVFYLRISSAFAAISEIVNNPPRVTKMPANFTKAFATEDNVSQSTELAKTFCSSFLDKWTWMTSDACAKFKTAQELNKFLRQGKDWFQSAVQQNSSVHESFGVEEFDHALQLNEPDTSVNMDSSNISSPVLSGLSGMSKIDSANMNPLSTVVTWGNVMIAAGMIAAGIGVAGLGQGWSELAFTLAATLFVPGFVLAFWVPTIPFMHFTFAVIEWMISILEAVIGMPLWALSLITLEGDGLGQVGMAGVKRLFEIILRPTIIIMALVASILLFTAGVSFFNSALGLYQDAEGSLSQHGTVSAIGMLFVYMFGVYSLATSCFKLIDAIPDNFGRWMGLEKGFGSNIQTGVSQLEGILAGGYLLGQLTNYGKQGSQTGANVKAISAKAKDGK